MLQTIKILKILQPVLLVCLFLVNISHAQKPDLKTIVIDPGHGGVDVGAGGRYSREAILALNISLKVREVMQKEMPDVRILMTRETDILPGNLSNKNEALRWRANFANENNADLFISIHLNSTPANQRWEKKQVGTKKQTYYVKQGKKKVAKTRTVPVYERYRAPATVLGTQTYILASDYYKGKVASAGRSSSIKDYVDADSAGGMPEVDPVEARIKAQQYAKYFFQKSLTLATYVEEEFANIGRYSWGVWQRDWAGAQGIYVLTATQMPSILIETGFIDHPDEEEFLNSSEGLEKMAKSIVNAVKRYREVLQDPEKMIQQTAATTEE
ncbi:MAG: N-acetylmuramoyl-L-alanine amidase [Chitinophagaceae bacterium]|nr:N-acetylmuramoyl-L-alanine amidase [Chitinophagaceae bacterium]